jgi:hypothetical protein
MICESQLIAFSIGVMLGGIAGVISGGVAAIVILIAND